jgi:secernin
VLLVCDTFVAVGTASKNKNVFFGKNSDRPFEEQQPLAYYPRKTYRSNEEVKCTYLSIPQVEETYALLVSQPSWMWGGEMGANEFGVVIGNEAVWTKEPYQETGLLGMDLLRLALERSKSAQEALNLICNLLDTYGQGGSCGQNMRWYYHNSFLITDHEETWVLETAGKWWIAQKIKDGVRNISNNLSIHSNFDRSKDGIVDYAVDKGYCNDSADFDFARDFSEGIYNPPSRFTREGYATNFLQENSGQLDINLMLQLLRDHQSGICMHGGYRSTASQISWLIEEQTAVHYFTISPHPCISVFKPIACPSNAKTEQFSLWKERDKYTHPLDDILALELHNLETQILENSEVIINEKSFSPQEMYLSFKDILEEEKTIIGKSH